MPVEVKICGVSDPSALVAAVKGGARYVGFVFFPRSPRFVTAVRAAALAQDVPAGIMRVGLFVDADDETISDILSVVPLDVLQLHGRESPARVTAVRERFRLPIMKAIALSEESDLVAVAEYAQVADRLLFDAHPPANATRPGGNAQPFDWRLLAGRSWRLPWLLAGGLTAANLAEAVRLSGATGVDVSSGVEDAPGHKNIARIKEFLDVARRIESPVGAGV
jgi:phosphoribosylanthranilate isomerase